ncbi:dihydroorotase [Pelistega suis]|uniref:Dihydroorotase n=1 Tax=Pelistega suis TaxID=1631957 RepID=A0A849P7U6_9BURK|nr:dihydroorotase [Pelistega suis]NOL52374.1 dihydroorotase [Pelistega suis]
MKLRIINGRLLNPATKQDEVAVIDIAAGRIVGINSTEDFSADQVIDAAGKAIIPGLVDLSVRLREPGNEHRATLETEMRAALAGGVTSLVLPPDTDPSLDEPGLVEMLKHRARQLNQANLYPLGAMTVGLKGEVLTEMAELTEAGCVAFSQANKGLLNLATLNRAMLYAKTFDYTLWIQPSETDLASSGVAASGAFASRLGLSGIPVQAETIALHALFELQRSNKVRLHLCRVTSAEGIELVRQAKARGLPVTCDVSINHLHLTDTDIGFFDSNYRLYPPLRSQRDREAITQGLLDGTIDAICSDHTPMDDEEKLLPFAQAEAGAVGVEILLSLVYKWAQEHKVPLLDALAKITFNPYQILKAGAPALPPCGQIAVGAPADLAIVDLGEYWQVNRQTLVSQSAHTPFSGYEVPAKVKMTIVGGRIAWE